MKQNMAKYFVTLGSSAPFREVFGTGQALPSEYALWPQGVMVVSCRGEGPDARIMIDPGVTDGRGA